MLASFLIGLFKMVVVEIEGKSFELGWTGFPGKSLTQRLRRLKQRSIEALR